MKIKGNSEIIQLIDKFKDGFSILSLGKWVSSAGFRVSFAGVLGVCGVIFAAKEGVFNNFEILSRKDDDGGDLGKLVVPGLRNLGNNCFLNVILQALSSCSYLTKSLETTVKECQRLLGEDWIDTLPLTAALASLIEDLRNVHLKRVVLDPRKLMNVMDSYISNFNLASQQDAEEALFHVLSSLRDEVSSVSGPFSSLADIASIENRRILLPKSNLEQSELKRWEKSFLGPFNGIVGSSLTCESCSFQISVDFQFFHSLHISPVLCRGADAIMTSCSLQDCLKHYFVAEQLENYCCSNCWHLAAVKYLSLTDGNETEVERLRHCYEQDSCDCKDLPSLEAMRWSNNFSRTFKQLSIARSPKILCIHLQRVSVNSFGELVKLQGNISFPLILKLSPFMKNYMDAKNTLQTVDVNQQLQHYLHRNNFHSQFHTSTSDGFYREKEQGFLGPNIPQTGVPSDNEHGEQPIQSDNKADESYQLTASSKSDDLYQLVSVVEHFGSSGSGHYTVYRRVLVNNDGANNFVRWFAISDSQVHGVMEREVLEAEASLLFYEKVSENTEIS